MMGPLSCAGGGGDLQVVMSDKTWGAGVDTLNQFKPHPSLYQFETHFLDRFVPINYRYNAPIKWYLMICNTGTLYQ